LERAAMKLTCIAIVYRLESLDFGTGCAGKIKKEIGIKLGTKEETLVRCRDANLMEFYLSILLRVPLF
jgi:hypothetical protein